MAEEGLIFDGSVCFPVVKVELTVVKRSRLHREMLLVDPLSYVPADVGGSSRRMHMQCEKRYQPKSTTIEIRG